MNFLTYEAKCYTKQNRDFPTPKLFIQQELVVVEDKLNTELMLICREKKLIGVTFDTRLCRPYCCQAGLFIYIVISSLSHFFLCKAGCSIFISLEDKRRTVNPPPRQRLKQNPSKIYSYIYFSDPKRTTWPGRRLMRATWFCFKTIQKLLDKIPFYR